MNSVSVVIPTRNRHNELSSLLQCLMNQTTELTQIIVVDSSDDTISQELCEDFSREITYIRSEVRSAAIQRNIGIQKLYPKPDFLGFLDDDILITRDYFSKLIYELKELSAVGISGIAINPSQEVLRKKPSGLAGLAHRIFLLDSKKDGKLLLSGINIPLRNYDGSSQKVDWLIGCSIWDFKKVKDLTFEPDFYGQSLGEDVIFSLRAGRIGNLYTNPRVILSHSESPIGRPLDSDFYRMWVINRYRLVQLMQTGILGKISFLWANLGQSIILCYLYMRGKKQSRTAAKVILLETLKLLKSQQNPL